jgi:ABC-2 type transport system permease protein
MEKHLNNIIRKERLIQNGTDTSVINMIDVSVDIGTKKITAKGTEKDYTEAYAGIGYILGFFIYIMMMLYGSLVMRSVIEEKANRIIEVIASSARPFEIMMGKVIGIGLVGMTQVTFWLVVGGILLASAGPIMMMFMPKPEVLAGGMQMAQVPQLPIDIPRIPISLILGFIFYFIAGYFIYSTLFAAVGSAVDQESDAAQLQTPVMLPIILPMMFMPAIMANPDGPLAVILSLIPFFTPILMIVRVAATNVPLWQIALSVVLLIGTFFGALWATSKIYRVGILMYGKKPKLSDLIKWIKLAK